MFSSVLIPTTAEAGPRTCGLTTLDATIADTNGDGILECTKGDEMIVRDDLAGAGELRRAKRTPLMSLLLFADFQLADEELTLPSRSEWRGHPAMLPHMMNAQLGAANAIATRGGPVLGRPYSMAFGLGDLADNAQVNETQLVIDVMEGGKLVDPDSGADGYDGPRRDPLGRGDLRSPVTGERLLDLANEPFYAHGLRNSDGSRIPWYAVHGNHDSKVMGHIPGEGADWKRKANDWATGTQKFFTLSSRYRAELDRLRERNPEAEPEFWMRIFDLAKRNPSSVGDLRAVEADPERRIMSKTEWLDEITKGISVQPCPDVYANPEARRACYSFDQGKFRFIALDDNPLEGFSTGSIDRAQFRWIERQLIDASSVYFDRDGNRIENENGESRYVVVLSHHTSKGMRNRGTNPDAFDEMLGEDLERLLLRFPNVIAHANGHSHSNKVWTHRDRSLGTQYWEINTASLADAPHQARSLEIADNGDGTLSMFGVVFEPAVHPNPRAIDWTGDDPTDERQLGDADRTINEDWLAAAGMEQALTERRGYRFGSAKDRNVEMLIPDPMAGIAVTPTGVDLGAGDIQVIAASAIAFAFVLWYARRKELQRPVPPKRGKRLPRRTPPRSPEEPDRPRRREKVPSRRAA